MSSDPNQLSTSDHPRPPSSEITIEHPELMANEVSGVSFYRVGVALSARHVFWLALMFAVANLLVWPTDWLIFDASSPMRSAFHEFRVGAIALGLVAAVAIRKFRPARRRPSVVLALSATAMLTIAAFTAVATWHPALGMDIPWFYTGYLTPLVTITLVVPLRQRILVTALIPASAFVLFAIANWTLVERAFVGVALITWVFTASVSVLVGEVLYRLLRVNFDQRRQLAARARELEDSRDGLQAMVDWLHGINENLSEQVRGKAQDLGQLLDRLDRSRRDERHRLSKELQGQLGDQLARLRHELESVRRTAGSERSEAESLNRLDRRLQRALDTLRGIVAGLEPSPVRELGFTGALEQHVATLRSGYAVTLNTRVIPPSLDLPEDEGDRVLSLISEALKNALVHAQAADVNLTVAYTPGRLTVRVADNGRGFVVPAELATGSPGLGRMQELADGLQGTLRVESEAGKGTVVQFECPLIATS